MRGSITILGSSRGYLVLYTTRHSCMDVPDGASDLHISAHKISAGDAIACDTERERNKPSCAVDKVLKKLYIYLE